MAKKQMYFEAAIRIHRLEALDGSHIGPSEWYKNGTLPGSVFETEIKSDLNLNMNRLKQLEIGHDGVGNVGVCMDQQNFGEIIITNFFFLLL